MFDKGLTACYLADMRKNPEIQFNVNENLRPLSTAWAWQEEGLCSTVDPELFFLEHNLRGDDKQRKEATAKSVCNYCPVKTECLEHALSVPEMYGVWGGLSADERMDIVKFKMSIDRAKISGEEADDTSSVYSL